MKSARINPWARRFVRRLLWIFPAATALFGVLFAALWWLFPFDRAPLDDIPASVRWCDRDGIPLRISLSKGGFDSLPIYQHRADDWIAKALVAAEDQRFWSHHGVDPLAVARSCKQTTVSFRRVSGASTVSMQLIRLSWPRPRTLPTKAVEAFRALQMERQLSKPEILSLYLNRAPFGANLIGIESAARRYFGKGAHDLSLGEASLLAGIPQSPTRFNPVRNPAAAGKRQRYVLGRMLACRMISREQMEHALAQPLDFHKDRYPFLAPHFCDMLTRNDTHGAIEPRTTLDLRLQRTVEETMAKHTPTLRAEGIHGGAVVVLRAGTGEILALVGSQDFRAAAKGSQVNAATAPRSAGSTFKPFAYALAFDRGSLTPQRILYDLPQNYSDYDPENFDKGHSGVVTARDALVGSLNLPAIEVERSVGQPLFHSRLRELGLHTLTESPERYGLGLVLGNAEATLLDLTNAYACLARGGIHLPYRTTPGAPGAGTRLFSAEAAWMVTDILGGDERAMDSTGTVADIRIPRLAWKTGTSSGYRDAWTIAYNPEYVIGVWLGNPNGRPSKHLVGRKAATPVVWDICRRLYPDGRGPWFAKPEDVETREVCALSGQSPSPHCPRIIHDHAIREVSRYETCEVHPLGPEPTWPARVAEFLAKRQTPAKSELLITSPANNSAYLFVPDAHLQSNQSIPLTASSGDPAATLHWFVDEGHIGTTKSGETVFWPLRRGTHHIVCSDGKGASRAVRVSVQ